jgi:hypothetical protein
MRRRATQSVVTWWFTKQTTFRRSILPWPAVRRTAYNNDGCFYKPSFALEHSGHFGFDPQSHSCLFSLGPQFFLTSLMTCTSTVSMFRFDSSHGSSIPFQFLFCPAPILLALAPVHAVSLSSLVLAIFASLMFYSSSSF